MSFLVHSAPFFVFLRVCPYTTPIHTYTTPIRTHLTPNILVHVPGTPTINITHFATRACPIHIHAYVTICASLCPPHVSSRVPTHPCTHPHTITPVDDPPCMYEHPSMTPHSPPCILFSLIVYTSCVDFERLGLYLPDKIL